MSSLRRPPYLVKQIPEQCEGTSCVNVGRGGERKSVPGIGNNVCKGPVMERTWTYLWGGKETDIAELWQARQMSGYW